METIKHICKCGSNNVSIMSIIKDDKNNSVEIVYVCNNCGNAESEKHYLYKN